MDKDALLKLIQDWTNNVPLLIIGSGASVPYKLPTMWELGNHLKKSISFTTPDDTAQFDSFKALFDKHNDLETALNELQLRPNVLGEIVAKTWEVINQSDIAAYDQFVSGVEFPLANLIKYLMNTAIKKVSIITTNYDRLAEYAASFAGAFVCTGYSQNYIGHFSNQIHTNNIASLKGYAGQANIWKVHGSLDWFKTQEENDIHLPLRQNIPANHKPSIVTPGLSKYFETHIEPYRTIFSQADNEIDTANGYLCIGYGFNDIHVQPKLITQIKSQKPIIVITKKLTDKTKQAIIGNSCKNYVLLEEDSDPKNTKVYTSAMGEGVLTGTSSWQLSEYLKLLKP
ncbi:MAG: SIR2 family protein [Flavipsychrobacter sp.]|nr:SIR2 family protein [Flavipsychrobacter sp.]